MLIEANRPQTVGTARTAWWIVSRGREALLAVFGHEEEAGMFLWSLGPGKAADGWRVAETRCGELASVLCGPCWGTGGVALDPLPDIRGRDGGPGAGGTGAVPGSMMMVGARARSVLLLFGVREELPG